jgi:hypothetical protein
MARNHFGVNPSAKAHPFERLLKNVRHRLNLIHDLWVHGKRPPAIVTYPELPSRRSALHKICRELNWELTNVQRAAPILTLRFEDQTEKKTPMPNWLLQSQHSIWNENCTDIRKSTLEKAHVAAFGYGMAVNPCNHAGTMVVKSEFNAKHDGQTIQGPINLTEQRPDSVYQIDIDNTDEQGRHFDFRLVHIKGSIALAYKKYKAADTRFTNLCESAILIEVEAALNDAERENTQSMMELLHVDYAELDALRDSQSGKLFIIDVNPTPWGPPAELPIEQKAIAVQVMANALKTSVTPATPSNNF